MLKNPSRGKAGGFAVLLLMLYLAPVWAAEEELGRLFFDRAQRAALQELRSETVRSKPRLSAEEEKPPPIPNLISLDGVVLRSNGETAVWINGSTTPPGLRPNLEGISGLQDTRDVSVPILILNGGQTIQLKPGQSYNSLSQEVLERHQAAKLVKTGGAVQTRGNNKHR